MMYFLLILLDGVLLTNYHQAMSNSVSIEPTARIQLTSDEKTLVGHETIFNMHFAHRCRAYSAAMLGGNTKRYLKTSFRASLI
jgi:hypothetical protein